MNVLFVLGSLFDENDKVVTKALDRLPKLKNWDRVIVPNFFKPLLRQLSDTLDPVEYRQLKGRVYNLFTLYSF